jgi:hypothetical protein
MILTAPPPGPAPARFTQEWILSRSWAAAAPVAKTPATTTSEAATSSPNRRYRFALDPRQADN